MSDSTTITWEGKKLNPRDEEKFLDDKLMALGLLEPGMSLQEKKDLASVVLESTRMAQEQMSQRVEEEEWEDLLMSQGDAKGSGRSAPKGPELITIPDESEADERTKICVNQQEDSDSQSTGSKEFVKRNERERSGKRDREDSRRVRGDEKRLEIVRREDEKGREANTRMKKREKERRDKEEKMKEEEKKKKEEREREERELQKKKCELRERREEEMRRREVRKKEMERADKKQVTAGASTDVVNTHKPNAEGTMGAEKSMTNLFYGPSFLRDVKQPSPLRSEVYGSSQKSRFCRVPQVSLIHLAEEVLQKKGSVTTEQHKKKEHVSHQETSEGKLGGVRELARSSKEKDIGLVEKDDGDRKKFLKAHMKGRKVGQDGKDEERHKESPTDENEEQLVKFYGKGGKRWTREAKKRGEPSQNVSITGEGILPNVNGNSERIRGNCEKRRKREPDNGLKLMEGSREEAEDEQEGQEGFLKDVDSLSSDVKAAGEKRRRLEKGQLTKKWVDVVISKSSKASEIQERDITKDSNEIKTKEVIMPNKRWRRSRRKYRSSYGSGSEVDEWISSEEERKSKTEPLSKEQIVAKFDDYLIHLKNALQKQCLNESAHGNKQFSSDSCKQKSKCKVPPGFQEPDSDDEWNLWKICFSNKTSSSTNTSCHNSSLTSNSLKEGKTDAIPLSYKTVVTRSQKKQKESSESPRSASKSPCHLEDGCYMINRSPLQISPVKDMLPGSSILSNDSVRLTSKSPSQKDIPLFEVSCPIPRISKSTQTRWDDDMDSNQSSSSSATVVQSTSKSKDISLEAKPVWDLLELDSEIEEGNESSEDIIRSKMNKTPANITKRRTQKVDRNSSKHLPMEQNEEDISVPSVSDRSPMPKDVGKISLHLSDQPASEPSFSKTIKKREMKENERPFMAQHDRCVRKVDKAVKRNTGEENEEKEQKVQPLSPDESTADLPESVACPICNRIYPMSEIEAHASGCNPEEEDESSAGEATSEPLLGRGRRHRAGGGRVEEVAGASHQRFKMEVKEEEEEDDDDFEDAEGEENTPRPPPLASFVPISQQKDSLIDYSDQFPHKGGVVNLQASLERMRKSLMRGGKRRSVWRKKKRGKWRRGAKK